MRPITDKSKLNPGQYFSCLCLCALFLSSCAARTSLARTITHYPASVLVIQPVPFLLSPADEPLAEDGPSSSLALASDSYSGSGLAIALSGDDQLASSPGR